jgi:molybdopterin-binding protein
MKISARNVLKGKIIRVTHGLVDSEIAIELPGGSQIVSTMVKSSSEHLGLAQGQEVLAIIRGIDVLIALD